MMENLEKYNQKDLLKCLFDWWTKKDEIYNSFQLLNSAEKRIQLEEELKEVELLIDKIENYLIQNIVIKKEKINQKLENSNLVLIDHLYQELDETKKIIKQNKEVINQLIYYFYQSHKLWEILKKEWSNGEWEDSLLIKKISNKIYKNYNQIESFYKEILIEDNI